MNIKGQGHSLTLDKGHLRFLNLSLFFSDSLGSFETKFQMKDYRRMGMKIQTNKLAHMTKKAVMPIYGKNL